MELDFGEYGKGIGFAGKVLGRSIRTTSLDVLNEMAVVLFGEKTEEDRRKEYLKALASYGITDRRGLLYLGPRGFAGLDFGVFGKGTAFAKKVISKISKDLLVEDLNIIADVLELPVLSDQSKRNYREVLASHGIIDRNSLFSLGSDIRSLKFGDYGKAHKFLGRVLGRTIKHPSLEVINEFADVLDLPIMTKETKTKFRGALAFHGIRDRMSLFDVGTTRFSRLDFGKYGKGIKFAGKILCIKGKHISISMLVEMADLLDLPNLSMQSRELLREILADHNIRDREAFLSFSIRRFLMLDFGKYGKGFAFANKVLGRTIKVISLSIFNEMANVLFPEESDEEIDNPIPNA